MKKNVIITCSNKKTGDFLINHWLKSLEDNVNLKNDEKTKKEIWHQIKGKPIINAGVIFAPSNKFIDLCQTIKKMIKNKNDFGPDQIVVNYFLYKNKLFKFINNKYNFMMSTEKKGFILKKGVFYKKNGKKIVIVHNSGQMDFFRPINDFGYSERKNKLKHFIYHLKKTQYQILETYKKIFPD